MIAREATPHDVRLVCWNLRPESRREVWAARFDNPNTLIAGATFVEEQVAAKPIKRFALCPDADSPPAALAGAFLAGPRAAGLQLLSTPQWLTLARPAYVWLRRVFWPCVLVPNVAVAMTMVLDGPPEEYAWLERLGMTIESRALPIGPGGLCFRLAVWINPTPPA